MTEWEVLDPFSEGFRAYLRGLSRTRSPYKHGTLEHAGWAKGWLQAELQDSDEDADIGLVYLQGEDARGVTL